MRTKAMTSIAQVKPTFSRAIGLMLVLFIFYGTTVEAAHYHGRALARNQHVNSSVADSGAGKNLTQTKLGCSDCLLCQLHQSFSSSLISVRANLQSSSQRVRVPQFVLTPVRSLTNTPQTGRAPPLAN
jgi:hypothetical protein